MTNTSSKDVSVIKASQLLQSKVGKGPLDGHKVKASQEVIDNNRIDFAPLGNQFLDELEVIIADKDSLGSEPKIFKERITQPVMQLKANARMFKYGLVGELATIMLNFLEEIKVVDQDVVDIVDAHQKTLRTIISQRLTDEESPIGKTLIKELKSLCARYFSKQQINASDIFVVDG